ncbi:hypothetical protein [Streptomyces sp. XD-27]|uniref:hypothetical protein n=1 Tax=Streptomyces sp. XD-27 TaxID=3062779 RepID=UPI0026F444D6|nr:hypothetical protein [Streptomyces sp. XD-27]WKX71240.1 hypothetical protein Q3Y56_16210 [Streptomyces sp. XD-27]
MFSVTFSMGPGLVLRLATETASASISATNLAIERVDPLASLIHAVCCLASGTPDVSCRWPLEPGGHFIDLSRITEERCGIAVHSFADPDWLAGKSWLPVRGALVFGAAVPTDLAVTGFIKAFVDLGTGHAKDFERRWPWAFPETELSRLVDFWSRKNS